MALASLGRVASPLSCATLLRQLSWRSFSQVGRACLGDGQAEDTLLYSGKSPALGASNDRTASVASTAPSTAGNDAERSSDLLEKVIEYNVFLPCLEGHKIVGEVKYCTRRYVVVDSGFREWVKFPRGTLTTSRIVAAKDKGYRASQLDIRPGDRFHLTMDVLESPYGNSFVSANRQQHDLHLEQVWRELRAASERRRRIMGRVLHRVNGGYAVGVGGYVAFAPQSWCPPEVGSRIGVLQEFEILEVKEASRSLMLASTRGGVSFYRRPRQGGFFSGLKGGSPAERPRQ